MSEKKLVFGKPFKKDRRGADVNLQFIPKFKGDNWEGSIACAQRVRGGEEVSEECDLPGKS